MGGLTVLFIVLVWFLIVLFSALFIANQMRNLRRKMVVMGVIMLSLLPLPLIDEILGKREFEQLCRQYSTVQINRETARGRTVYLEKVQREQLTGYWLPIRLDRWRYIDSISGDLVLSSVELHASRNWFQGERYYPWTFQGLCVSGGNSNYINGIFSELNITEINRTKEGK